MDQTLFVCWEEELNTWQELLMVEETATKTNTCMLETEHTDLPITQTNHSLIHLPTYLFTYSLTHPLIHSPTYLLTHALTQSSLFLTQ